MCRAAGIQSDHVCFFHICGKRNALEQIRTAGRIGNRRTAGAIVATKRNILDVDIFAQVIRAHLRNCDFLCGNGVQTALDHFGDTAGLELRNTAIGGSRAGDLYNVANHIFCVVGIVINLVAINFAVDHVLKDDGIDAGRAVIGIAVVIYDLTNDRDRAACCRCRFLDVQRTLGNHVVRNGVINVAVPLDFIGIGVAKLKRSIEDADSCRNIQRIAGLVFPFAVNLVDHSLIKLNGLAVCVFDGDIRLLKAAIVIIDLCDLHAADGDVGTDVRRRQCADGSALCAQRQAAGLLECSGAKLRKAVVSIPLACADDCITERNFCRLAGQPEADATGCILQIIILPVHQCYNALDGEEGVLLSGKRRADGNRGWLFSLHGVGKRRRVAVGHAGFRGLDGEGDIFIHSRRCAFAKVLPVRRIKDLCALGCAGERDLRSLVYLARCGRSSRGCDLLLRCCFKLPEAQRLACNITSSVCIAAPVRTIVDAKIARIVVAVLCRQIIISGKRPDTDCLADSHTVVSCGKIQIAAAGLDVIAAFCSGDRPSKAVAAASCQRVVFYSNLCCKRLFLASFASRGQNPRFITICICHGDGNGVGFGDVRQRNLGPRCRLWVGCKHGGRQQRYYHHQREQQRTPALELFSHSTFPPVFHHF